MPKPRLGFAVGLLVSLVCSSCLAAGMLNLSRTEMTIAPDQPPGELWVENKGDTPLYLDVTQQLVTNPGQLPEHLVPVEEVPQPTLLILPNRLVLSPGQKYRMALKALSKPDRALVWRVTFRPRERIAVDGDHGGEAAAPLFVSIGYGAVIYQLHDANGSTRRQ
ncbi:MULTISPECIES: hypothetical protein [Burkholderia]|uniref:Pilus assembly protein n=1 Tax=Burkholderia contaminans TaxID=488447 RepID=A0A2S5E419_9BURK|nr:MULTISPECIES: hypothetical protein [Burkholderia]EKS9798739.1 hypothetical protein [Burkholderia cepacia]EKS9803169.1 hypothetical protein [Burkholderia cepacia]EKS9810653.1 hypothetical protein [Burkholderia cepacia]EKS9819616.1 hypothetical protein [Burkholderia cepacia]EKS9827234.1 hypothetical protein [Burkholderia cepacia]